MSVNDPYNQSLYTYIVLRFLEKGTNYFLLKTSWLKMYELLNLLCKLTQTSQRVNCNANFFNRWLQLRMD